MKRSLTVEKTIIGFTLAEVLITLTVIGVIAALTIPSLITNIQDAQYKTAWKRTFSDLNQAVNRAIQNNAGSIKNVCATSDCFVNLFKPYLSYTKLCYNDGLINGNCWLLSTNYLNGGSYTDSPIAVSGMILNNGALLRVWINSSSCSTPVGSPVIFTRCGGIMIDTNGFKGPNTWGKDVFGVYLLENQIKPFGIQGDGDPNDCNTNPPSGMGQGCAAVYLYQ